MAKIEPSELTLNFVLTDQTNEFIDLSQCASLVNRRFYRQGINWAVKGFTLHNLTGTQGSLQISKLPSTWVMSNAWEKSMRTWLKQNNEALEETESIRPRFMDFKVYADVKHHELGFAANLVPFVINPDTGNNELYTVGEWAPSEMQIPTGTADPSNAASRELIAVGPNYPGTGASGLDAVSLIEGYAASRGLPNVLDPNAPADAADVDGFNPDNWMAATFNEGTRVIEQVIDEALDSNNIAPYPFENDGTHIDTQYPGGANQASAMVLHDQLNVTGTTVSNSVRARGGQIPAGLIRIRKDATLAGAFLQVHLVPGNHRGYLCEPMTDM
jgi:hypothetical protein